PRAVMGRVRPGRHARPDSCAVMRRVRRGPRARGDGRDWSDRPAVLRRMPFAALSALLLLPMMLAGAPAVQAQSLLERSPNLGGTWTGEAGTLHFHFMHRFEATDPPARKVLNSPTFLLGATLPHRVLVGARYATNSL